MPVPMQTLRLLAMVVAVAGVTAPLWARGAGDPTPLSNAPMVAVLNPGRSSVVGNPFRLQVHVAGPAAGGAILSVAYTTDGTAPACGGTSILPVNARYDGGTGGAIYETSVPVAAAGSYTLRVCARNGAGTVEAPAVSLTVTTLKSPGDGNLLIRDNSNQLCTDCHALQSHTSQATSNRYGSWSTTCRDCHVPHGSRNAYLVPEAITPPDVHGANAGGARAVRFANTVGDSGVAGAMLPGQSSFANSDNTGPCQVCHTQTQGQGGVARFRQAGNSDTHFTGTNTQNCAACHLHSKGFAGSCTTCHGSAARAGEQVAPPLDTCGNATAGRVGTHTSHLDGRLLSLGVACAECHLNPPVGGHPTWASCDPDPSHHAIMTWGTLAATVLPGDTGTVTPTWDVASQTCSNYCHGNFKNGNRLNTATWNGTAACGSCHGVSTVDPVPPSGHPAVAAGANCNICHPGYEFVRGTGPVTGTGVDTATHVNGQVEGGVHAAGWKEPSQHGVGAGGALVGASGPSSCTTCHTGYGPASGVASSSCNGCHATPAIYGPYTTGTYPNHLNWQTECTFCHGGRDSTTTGAPPRDVHVISSDATTPQPTTLLAVGAHTSHAGLGASPTQSRHGLGPAFACTACHPGYASFADAGHINQTSAIASFGNVGTTPNPGTYATNSCAANYCHGNFTGGAGSAAIAWTGTFGASATVTCASCHGNPPAPTVAGHPNNNACQGCHGAGYTRTTATTGTVVAATHVNGTTNLTAALTCTSCHGTSGRSSTAAGVDANLAAAPPNASTGATATTDVNVGTHQAHVMGSRSRALACTECHTGEVPAAGSWRHASNGTAISFGAIARTGAVSPLYGGSATPTCGATYCHGNFTYGAGAAVAPSFIVAGTLLCTACHGNPPAHPHPGNTGCAACHGAGYTWTTATTGTVVQATHVDGLRSNLTSGCTACHGDRAVTGVTLASGTVNAAPGYTGAATSADTVGGTATSAPGVGAHRAHLFGTRFRSAPIACIECHALPATDTNTAHGSDAGTGGARAALTFTLGTLANNSTAFGTHTSSYAGSLSGSGGSTAGTCSGNYCHAPRTNDAAAGVNLAPSWTGTIACGGCHGLPPVTTGNGDHPANSSCGTCHPSYTITGVNLATHIDGKLDGGGEPATGGSACGGCHGTTFAGMQASGGRLTRHTLTSAAAADTAASWTNPLKSAAPYATASCVTMCHSDHPHTLTTPLTTTHDTNVYVDAGTNASRGFSSATRTASNRARTDFDNAQTNGGLCTSCHQNPVDTGHPAITRAAYNASAHNYVTGGGSTWQYSLDSGAFDRNCTKCHASRAEGTTPVATTADAVHFSDDPSLLAGKTVSAGSAAGTLCFNCHGNTATPAAGAQGNRSGKNLQDEVASAFGHPTTADTVHNSVTEGTTPLNGGLFTGVNRHVNCIDCHDPHAAQAIGSGSTTGTITTYAASVTDYTTGTASIARNGTVVTGTGTAFTAAMVGRALQFNADPGVWYGITAFTSATSITVSPASGSARSGAYIIRGAVADILTDSTKAWTKNQYKGWTLRMVSGAQSGRTSAIYGNGTTTGTQLLVKFGTAPGSGDRYVIVPSGMRIAAGAMPPGSPAMAGAWGVQPTFNAPPAPPSWNDGGTSGCGAADAANSCEVVTGSYAPAPAYGKTTASPPAEAHVCLKCHSSFAFGSVLANFPVSRSGQPNAAQTTWSNTAGAAMRESDLAGDANPGNAGHHAIFGRGPNQPMVSSATVSSFLNPSWPRFTSGQVTASGTTVTLSTGTWPVDLLPGWFIYVGSSAPVDGKSGGSAGWYEVASVTSDTLLTIDRTCGTPSTCSAATAYLLTPGLGATFVPPYGPWSVLECSDCHRSSVAGDPFGPHGSTTKWLLRSADTPTFLGGYASAINSFTQTNTPTDPNNFCLNCHRRDVYGDYTYVPTPATIVPGAVYTFSRQSHPADKDNGSSADYRTRWGIECMNCHGGARQGAIHGVNLGQGGGGTGVSHSGKRLLAGSSWYAVTRSSSTTAGQCWTKGNTDAVDNCGHAHNGVTFESGAANYDYQSTQGSSPVVR